MVRSYKSAEVEDSNLMGPSYKTSSTMVRHDANLKMIGTIRYLKFYKKFFLLKLVKFWGFS